MAINIIEKGKEIAKFGSPDEQLWTNILNGLTKENKDCENLIKVNKEFIVVCQAMIKKFKL